MSKIRLCVTGGSGFIGTATMSWALQKKYDVINYDIRPPKISEHEQYWRDIDILDAESFSEALSGFQPTHIIHLAAMTGMDIVDSTFFDTNTKGVANLIQATKRLLSLQRIIFASTLLVCKNGYVPSSDTEYDPPNLYGESKVIGEKMVRDSEMNCSWVIVRPTSVWGPWFEHSYRTFFQMIDRGFYFQPGYKPIIKPLNYVGNTVHMMQNLLLSPGKNVNGNTYYLGDYPENSIQYWADLVRKNLGKGKTPSLPIPLIKVMALIGDLLKKTFHINPPITTFRLNNMLTGSHYPLEKTQEVVGTLPFSMQDGVQQTLAWMYSQKLIRNKPCSLTTIDK